MILLLFVHLILVYVVVIQQLRYVTLHYVCLYVYVKFKWYYIFTTNENEKLNNTDSVEWEFLKWACLEIKKMKSIRLIADFHGNLWGQCKNENFKKPLLQIKYWN